MKSVDHVRGGTMNAREALTPARIRLARSLVTLATAIVILWIILSPLSTRAAADAPGDPARGKQLFEKRCTGCHSLDADKEGPHLRGIYGRKAGTAPGFAYSDALKAANFTWNDALLEKWLTDTESVVPDNKMDFHVPNPDERADIIGYLRVSSGH
jgi:cytochrome c